MENENSYSNRCYMCRNFQRFFIKGSKRFNQIKLGRCCHSGETENIHHTCEYFKRRIKIGRINGTVRNALELILNELSSIREVIEEETDADEID